MKIWTHLFRTALVAMLMSANVANAQNILVLTTGGQNSRPAPELENKYMPAMVQEFSSPLTFGDFTTGGNPCSGTNSTTVGSLTKSVTCNQTELVNGTVMASSTFDPGYDLLVVASAYTTIDAADWAVIEDAVQTRKVRGAVFFIDTINGANTTAIEGLLSRVMGAPVTQGSQFPGGNFYFPLNTAAAAQSSFTGLPTLELNSGFYAYNGVPSRYALYTGVNGLATATPGNATDPTSATGIFVPQSDSYAGAGACVFGVTDIGWGVSGTGHNIGKLGNAFLTEFNKSAPDGICATPLAAPPTLAIQKTTTANTAAFPSNGVAVPYTVEVSNVSTTALALNVGVSDPQPTGITLGQWACTQITPAAPANLCPTGLPTGDLVTTIASLPAGAKLQFTTSGTVTDNTQSLTNVATLQLPPGAICDGGGNPCTSQVSFALPPSISVICEPSSILDSPSQTAVCSISSSISAPAGGLTVALIPPASPHGRYSTDCGSTITILEGSLKATCSITATPNDTPGDGDVNVTLALATRPVGANYQTGLPSQATVLVKDDDVAAATPEATLSCTPTTLVDAENQVSICTVSLSAPAPAGGLGIIIVPPATNGRYSTTCASPLAVPAGASTATCAITATPNTVTGDGSASALVQLIPGTGYGVGNQAQATVNINDDDQTMTVAPVPTLGQWAMMILSILVASIGVGLSRRQLRK